ncbi:MAG: hypothetical protein HUJ77_10370 [Clostridium sp.]|uniref:ATP cone domain-containing protein n=1 Tax=Clostridium sp. TaxID=1506 RepID=UPI0025BA8CAF|nr:ATP cone domain-containing protein [Clostridium sp.]MCF0148784.1 hypothetical protein [Clostridium sp.]
MKIIKNDGRLEDFDSSKIKTSIENAASDAGSVLNSSDLRILASDVEKILRDIRKDSLVTSSYEVTGAVIKVLKRDEFYNTLKAYVEFDK